MEWRIEVRSRHKDSEAAHLLREIHDLGYPSLRELEITRVYFLGGELNRQEVGELAGRVFADPIGELWRACAIRAALERRGVTAHSKGRIHARSENEIEILYNPGVSDPSETSIRRAIAEWQEASSRQRPKIKGQRPNQDLRAKDQMRQDRGWESAPPLREVQGPDLEVRSGKRYRFFGKLSRRQVEHIAAAILYNPLVQHIARPDERTFPKSPEYRFDLVMLDVLGKDIPELMRISHERQLALNEAEMLAIQRYYQQLGRNPTDVELETFAQTWSEHCKHKTFRGRIVVGREMEPQMHANAREVGVKEPQVNASERNQGANRKKESALIGANRWIISERGAKGKTQVINDLFKQTIYRVTKELNRGWCLSVFKDNSGVIAFDRRFGISFKVETHNHPSALEPYGGAATGIGGVIRDCLGTGLGARPILNTDVFCFAPPNLPAERIPKGVLHPRRILKGVVAGVRDYGNRMGIPTANGAVYFHEDFRCNPLVYCGTLGIIPRNKLAKKVRPGDVIVVMGARTGRDGIHGVTFASLELTKESEVISQAAVQIGNPIEEKKLTDAMLQARDLNLFNATTDCGGGGLSSAIGEIAENHGAVVDLDKVPLKYQGLSYTEIWISESQERQIVLVPPRKLKRLLRLCRNQDVEATAIGRVTDNHRLVLRYQGNQVAEIDLDFLHHGWSQQQRLARGSRKRNPEPALPPKKDYTEELLGLLGAPNIASKEWVIRQYDHEVQGLSVVKPLTGVHDAGPSDGCVIRPLPYSRRGVVVACGLNPRYGIIDPYNMAASAIDEALRNVVACGGDPEHTAILDNFCWGSPERPEQLAGFVRAARACYDIAKGFGTPFISGKDSFYNEFVAEDGKLHPIPPTLLISGVSVIPDCRRTVTMDLKRTDSTLFLLGKTYNELGGSEYYARHGILGNRVPAVRVEAARQLMTRLHRAIRLGLVNSCHDLSEGGLAVAIAEMCLSGGIGADIHLDRLVTGESIRRIDNRLFSESNSRFLVEVSDRALARFALVMRSGDTMRHRVPLVPIGFTRDTGSLRIFLRGHDAASCPLSAKPVINAGLSEMESVWRNGLSRLL